MQGGPQIRGQSRTDRSVKLEDGARPSCRRHVLESQKASRSRPASQREAEERGGKREREKQVKLLGQTTVYS